MSLSATTTVAGASGSEVETSTIRAISWRLIPFLVLAYFFSYLDRVNLSFAALQMNAELKFTPLIFAWGAGIFFVGAVFVSGLSIAQTLKVRSYQKKAVQAQQTLMTDAA